MTVDHKYPVTHALVKRNHNTGENQEEVGEGIGEKTLSTRLCPRIGDKTTNKNGHGVVENGESWSVGQRQLLCLGRALLKKSRILVLDEATTSVDSATNGVLHHIISQEFKDQTIVTIAHSIHTVIDSLETWAVFQQFSGLVPNPNKSHVRMADREASSSVKDADTALKGMYVILGRMVSCMENQQNNNLNHRGPNHDLESQRKFEMLKNFMNMHPQEFVGEGDPDKAENWIRNLEKIFTTMGLNDEMKLLLATFRLENDAACWWEMIDSKWTAAQTVRTWELFETEFN
ncbi:hypothetical protein RJ640_016834 [Escallonia rubra]|uniref:ABC transporter domain-containing protein n=1 Tax=Escallonia rubra TaxID=112253 RepID=A0AA88R0P8_9ASTE|nr:hypothetical protein RJ640_016834 [Escallonia rubra]